jgi:hypothetical protein
MSPQRYSRSPQPTLASHHITPRPYPLCSSLVWLMCGAGGEVDSGQAAARHVSSDERYGLHAAAGGEQGDEGGGAPSPDALEGPHGLCVGPGGVGAAAHQRAVQALQGSAHSHQVRQVSDQSVVTLPPWPPAKKSMNIIR